MKYEIAKYLLPFFKEIVKLKTDSREESAYRSQLKRKKPHLKSITNDNISVSEQKCFTRLQYCELFSSCHLYYDLNPYINELTLCY